MLSKRIQRISTILELLSTKLTTSSQTRSDIHLAKYELSKIIMVQNPFLGMYTAISVKNSKDCSLWLRNL